MNTSQTFRSDSMRIFRKFLIAALLALPLCAQLDTGILTGRVSDPSGAVVAGAQITVVETNTNFQSLTQTNAEGLYRIPALRPGGYTITITATGFKRLVRENIALQANNTMAIDVALEVGATTESVQVTAAAPMLQTETSNTGSVVEGKYIYTLPIYQRDTKAVLLYTPGVTDSGTNLQGFLGGSGGYHINGMESNWMGYFEDGMLGTTGDGFQTNTILNTVEEVKVLTTTLPAEYGHSAGGAITVAKKTGTNQLHGLASEYIRDGFMQHRKYFDLYKFGQPSPGFPKGPTELFQQPDGNLSGPVYIPKLYNGKNKTFFLAGIDRVMEKQSKQQLYTVPTPEMLNGNFSFGGLGQAIYDPVSTRQDASGNWLRDAFPSNIVPTNRWSKVATKLIGMNPWAAPNIAGSPSSTGPSSNLQSGYLKTYIYTTGSVRVDHQFTPDFKIYGTWTGSRQWLLQPSPNIANKKFDSAYNITPFTQNTASAGATWVVSPTLVSDTRVGYYRHRNETNSIAYMQNYAGLLGIPNLPPDTMPSGVTNGLDIGGPSSTLDEYFRFSQDVTKASGAHAFKMGYELMRYRQDSSSPGSPSGSFSYTSSSGLRTNGTAAPNTGIGMAAFLVGAVSSESFNYSLYSSLPRDWMHSLYIQDDWKILPTLTLNLGLRYSLETPPTQKYGFISIFDPNAPDTSTYNNYTCPAGGCLGSWTHPKGAKPYNTDTNNLQPRVGLAWHALPKLVVRTGFALNTVDMKFSFLNTSELTSNATSLSQVTGNPSPLFMIDQGPIKIAYPALRADGSVPFVGSPGGHSSSLVDPNLQAPYSMNWNFGLQYELHRDYVLELTYNGGAEVGTTGSQEMNSRPWGMIPNPTGSGWLNLSDPANATYRNTWLSNTQVSRPWPAWGNISLTGNNGHLTHHESTIKIEKRYSRGLNFQAFYTYGKTMSGNSGNPYLNWSLFRARTGADQTHRFAGSMNYDLPIGKGHKFLNRGGWLNTLFGGYQYVAAYEISSGIPIGLSISGQNTQNYPGYMGTYGGVILLKRPSLRNNWQDLGGDRWIASNENSMISCGFDGSLVVGWGNSCFTYVPSFSMGNNGSNLWDRQRIITMNMSISKEVPLKERLKLKLRYDIQNPFKWFNWDTPSTGLNMSSATNAKTYGTVTADGCAACVGGVLIQHVTVALQF